MISRLAGQLLIKRPPVLLIDVGGVGYECQAPMSTFYQLPDINQPVVLLTHLAVREDAHVLYGFSREQERRLFRALIKVSGVGPKLALAILSGLDPDAFARCVLENDTASMVRVPGVGKKTAERLVVEMRDRLVDWQLQSGGSPMSVGARAAYGQQEAIDALLALGYKPTQATRVVNKVAAVGMSSEEIIRLALQRMLVTA